MVGPVYFGAAASATRRKGARAARSRWPIRNGTASTICSAKTGRRCKPGGGMKASLLLGPSLVPDVALSWRLCRCSSTRTTTATSSSRRAAASCLQRAASAASRRPHESLRVSRESRDGVFMRPRRRDAVDVAARESARLARVYAPRESCVSVSEQSRASQRAPNAGRRLGRLARRRRRRRLCRDVF